MTSRTQMHVSLSVRGFLIGPDSDCKNLFKRDGKFLTPREAKSVLADYLSKGYEVLPFGDPCEGWDKVEGCPGHEVLEPEDTPREGVHLDMDLSMGLPPFLVFPL